MSDADARKIEELERRCRDAEARASRLEHAEQTAREWERLLQVVVSTTPDGFVVLDRTGAILEVNDTYCAMTGYTREELLGLRISDIDALERQEETQARITRVMETGSELFETRHRRKGGDEIPVEVSSTFIEGRFVSFFRDLSDRHQREERIAILGQMIDDVPASITIHDFEGKFLYTNRATLALHGYGPEEFLALSIADLDVPASQALIEERMREVAEHGQASFEVMHRRKDGTTFPLHVLAKASRWQGKPVLISVASDISVQKAAEQAQRDRRVELEQIFEAIPAALVFADPSRRLIRVNQNFVKLFGYQLDEVLGRTTEMLYADPKDFAEQGELRYSATARGSREPYDVAYRRKDGTVFPSETVGTAVLDAQGRVVGLMALIRDTTERTRAARERERLRAQLIQAQRMESVGRLAGGVAHDFNNMLNVIVGNVDLMLDDLPAGSPLREDLEEVHKAAERSAELTRQLLAFARKQTIAPRVLDLNETIESMLRMLGRLIGENIRLVWRPGRALPRVHVDPVQVDQILANLVVNARDAIGRGAGQITIETGEVEVGEADCEAHPGLVSGRYVTLAVGDDGCGMDAVVQAQVFEPFFTTKALGEGTGLGLATVYGIVKQNRGFIDLESAPGRGSRFLIYLPVHEGAPEDAPAGKAAPAARGVETVLVVEDELAILRLTTTMLRRLGYQVLAASTPAEAVARAESHDGPIHLLIVDVVMPEMNGRELSDRIRACRPGVRALFMSGYTADVIAHQGVLDEGLSFIQKPFSHHELAARVRQVLDATL